MYHHIKYKKDKNAKYFNYLEVNKFKKQIEYLKENFTIINPNQKKKFFFKEKNKKLCWLTFDDGYLDHYKYVFPILKKFNIFASFFPITSVLMNKTLLDANKIQAITNMSKNNTIISFIKKKFYENYKKKLDLKKLKNKLTKEGKEKRKFDKQSTSLIKNLLQKYLEKKFRKKLINELFYKTIPNNKLINHKNMYMKVSHLKNLKKFGHEIGCHSHNHEWIGEMKKKEAHKEIQKSINYFKKIFDCKNNQNITFCYPYGSYNSYSTSLLKKNGIKFALTTVPKKFIFMKKNCLKIGRFDTNDYLKLI